MEYVQIESPYSVAFDGMVTPVERVFLNRGMTPDYFKKYMSASAADILSPLLFENMRQGAEMLLRHIKNKSDVFIQVDSDCDGYTSSAALINYLYKLFPSFVREHITYRLHTGKQHGIILETVPENVSLVIVPDAGSNDFEQHKVLKERGCDVLVLDHHEIEGLSKDACIINNQIGGYPNRTLSGVGVVYKFCSYLDTLAHTNYAHDILDLVALGLDILLG